LSCETGKVADAVVQLAASDDRPRVLPEPTLSSCSVAREAVRERILAGPLRI
jgi:hypothetical protein